MGYTIISFISAVLIVVAYRIGLSDGYKYSKGKPIKSPATAIKDITEKTKEVVTGESKQKNIKLENYKQAVSNLLNYNGNEMPKLKNVGDK